MRYLRYSAENMKESIGKVFIIILELFIVIVAFSYFFSQIQDYIENNQIYSTLHLSRVLYAIVDEENREGIEEYSKNSTKVISLGYTMPTSTTNSGELLYPFDLNFFEKIVDEYMIDCKDHFANHQNENVVVIPKSLQGNYKIGNYYTFETKNDLGEEKTIRAYVIGSLQEDKMYMPWSGYNFIKEVPSTIMVYYGADKEMLKESDFTQNTNQDYGRNYLLYVDNNKDREIVLNELKNVDGVNNVYTAESVQNESNKMKRSRLGIPLILSVVILFMCLASFSSYTLLTNIRREKMYGIYYMCGATWKKCLVIQIMEDVMILASSIAAAMIALAWYEGTEKAEQISFEGRILAISICVIIFFVSSVISTMDMSRKSPVNIIRRWN